MKKNTAPRLIEPVPIGDELCTGGLVRIEDLGFGARFVLANIETCYEEDDAAGLIVKAKPVLLYRDVWPGLCMTANFMAKRGIVFPGVRLLSRLPFLHRFPIDRAR